MGPSVVELMCHRLGWRVSPWPGGELSPLTLAFLAPLGVLPTLPSTLLVV